MKEKLLIKQDSHEMFPTLWGKRVYFTTKRGISKKLLPLKTKAGHIKSLMGNFGSTSTCYGSQSLKNI